jgi:type III pantothenate kinase
MILCLDAGNTRLKWGLYSGGQHAGSRWLAQGACEHAAIETLANALPAQPERMLACNVAGAAVAARIEALAATLSVPFDWFRSSASACGVTNGYATPAQLGADRWAALIGARALHAGAALTVMAGTATTIDVLDAAGAFQGGLILPGLDLMRRSLTRNTADLPEARGSYRDIPANTDDAIVSGALHATLGAIERMAAPLRRPASADFLCLLSGGAADALAPHLDLPTLRIDNLVLEGLARVAADGVW